MRHDGYSDVGLRLSIPGIDVSVEVEIRFGQVFRRHRFQSEALLHVVTAPSAYEQQVVEHLAACHRPVGEIETRLVYVALQLGGEQQIGADVVVILYVVHV